MFDSCILLDQDNSSKIQKNKESSKAGRPSKQEQEKIKAKLWKYYIDGYSANYTVLQTGYNWRTVRSYFKEWTEELVDNSDFVAQQLETKTRLVDALDRRMEMYYTQLERIGNQIKKKSTIGLETLLAQVNKNLTTLLLDKAGVLMTPTVDVQIAQILKDRHGIDITKFQKTTS